MPILSEIPIRTKHRETIRILKSPDFARDRGRAWVLDVGSRGNRRICKVYSLDDAAFFAHEKQAFELYGCSRAQKLVPSLVHPNLESTTGHVLAYSYARGNNLAEVVPDPRMRSRILLQVSDRLVALNIPTSTNASLRSSKHQACYYWHSPDAFSELRIDDHLMQLGIDVGRSELIPLRQEILRWVQHNISLNESIIAQCTGIVHNDLHSFNVTIAKREIVVLDVGLSVFATRFLEWGGIAAHLGFEVWPDILDHIVKIMPDVPRNQLQATLETFAVQRAVRRIGYLSELARRSGVDGSHIEKEVAKQSRLIWTLLS